MSGVIKVKMEHGYYLFKLGQLLKANNISINKLITDTNTDFKVIKRLMSGNLVRIDIFVIERLCNYFKCNIEDIIEFIPYQKQFNK